MIYFRSTTSVCQAFEVDWREQFTQKHINQIGICFPFCVFFFQTNVVIQSVRLGLFGGREIEFQFQAQKQDRCSCTVEL